MNEVDFVKSIVELGLQGLLMAYIVRLDNQRVATEAENRKNFNELAQARVEDNRWWARIFTGAKPEASALFQSRVPTSLE